MNLSIAVHQLELWTHLGTTEDEREVEQRVLATITITPRSTLVLRSDRLADTVDYDAVVAIARKTSGKPHKTLEALAQDIGAALRGRAGVNDITVHLQKFTLPSASWASATVTFP